MATQHYDECLNPLFVEYQRRFIKLRNLTGLDLLFKLSGEGTVSVIWKNIKVRQFPLTTSFHGIMDILEELIEEIEIAEDMEYTYCSKG